MKNYREFIIKATPFQEELISGVLWQLDIDGLTEEGNIIKVYTRENADINKEKFNGLLNHMITEGLITSYSVEENIIEDKNWNEEWEKTINIIEVSEKIVIKPSFRDYQASPGKIVITIDPKMSFGTGEHETTKLMIHMIEKYVKPGDRILDAGTGTGVLAIASVKLGAKEAVAFDNDDWCYENGIENCQQNNVTEQVTILNCELDNIDVNPFNLVLANINKNILIDLAEGLYTRLDKAGILILSGLLFTDEEDIVKVFSSFGLNLIDKAQMNEWISVTFQKSEL